MSSATMFEPEHHKKPILTPTLKVTLPLLAVAAGVFSYIAFDSFYLPAYGENAEDLAYLKKADPRALSGGDLTHFKFGADSFAEEAVNLPWKLSKQFDAGDGHFERPFTPASHASLGNDADGLGPLFNAASCEACHMSDGRSLPVPGQSMLIRLSVPGKDANGGPKPHPVYGGQFGDVAIPGVKAEGTVNLSFREIPGKYADGEPYSLREPIIKLEELGYGPLGEETMTSTRVASSVFGLGLLEAISDETLRSWADPDDRDGDGISGRVNMVFDPENQKQAIGRFGWKAEESSILNQTAGAALNDMGVTSAVLTAENCTAAQTACNAAISGGSPENPSSPEFSYERLKDVAVYLSFLSVPARGHLDDPKVMRGETLFAEAGCASCHKATAMTGGDHELKRLRNQNIQPFTDLLLHDMGEGLADNRPSFSANGREWRTAPLWGIGMVETVNGHTNFLHDGRARGFEEAILWHGGEAEEAKEAFRTMEKSDRIALVSFLKSL